ncbi:condensation domain-containing protein [Dapis sp. BLCC M229]|uniref:condensation domain-containing protein n=1 Tax=Dapis sp. BLCC M229 TaxID=3400188 RepID=UPI003CE6B5EC
MEDSRFINNTTRGTATRGFGDRIGKKVWEVTNKYYSLSSPQLDIWLDQILHPDVPLYNIGGYVGIDGPIDPTLFEQGLNQVIEENEALRIIIHGKEELPRQTFAENVRINLDFQDFSTQENAREATIEWMKQEFVKPFQLNNELLFDFALCKAADNCYYWLNKYHHIIVDGWAISLIIQRLAAAYNALVTGTKCEAQYYSYQNFIQKDRAYLESEKFIKDRQYWQEKYRDIPDQLLVSRHAAQFGELPSKRSTLCLKRSFYNQLIEFAEEHNVSLFHVILGALYCYFVRTDHREDFTIGSHLLNRNTVAFKKTVGMFMSDSPAWFRFGKDLSVVELIEKIRKELQKDYRHQRFPCSEISLQVGEHENENLLFDFTISYAKFDFDVHFNDNPSRSVYLHNGFDPCLEGLFISIEEFHQQNDVNIYFDYNLRFFDTDEIELFKARLEFLLGEIVQQPSVPVREFQIIPDAEV